MSDLDDFSTLRGFIGLSDAELELVRTARPFMEPELDAMTERIRDRLLAHDTARHFSGDRQQVGVHVRATIERMLDADSLERLEASMDLRRGHDGVPRREMIALLGYLADDVSQVIWGLRLPAARRLSAIRAFQKLFWLQAAWLG